MPENTSRFIVLEGLDGAGTTTQAARLHEYFTHRGRKSFQTFEPTGGPIGSFTRGLLTGQDLSQRVLGLMFAADRLVHSGDVARHLAAESHVVCDRYIFSSFAYQTLDPDITAEWVAGANSGCATPDLTLFLDVPVDVCLARISARNETPSLYERKDRLQTIHDNYRRLAGFYEQHYGRLITIDGTASPDEVHAAIIAAL